MAGTRSAGLGGTESVGVGRFVFSGIGDFSGCCEFKVDSGFVFVLCRWPFVGSVSFPLSSCVNFRIRLFRSFNLFHSVFMM